MCFTCFLVLLGMMNERRIWPFWVVEKVLEIGPTFISGWGNIDRWRLVDLDIIKSRTSFISPTNERKKKSQTKNKINMNSRRIRVNITSTRVRINMQNFKKKKKIEWKILNLLIIILMIWNDVKIIMVIDDIQSPIPMHVSNCVFEENKNMKIINKCIVCCSLLCCLCEKSIIKNWMK